MFWCFDHACNNILTLSVKKGKKRRDVLIIYRNVKNKYVNKIGIWLWILYASIPEDATVRKLISRTHTLSYAIRENSGVFMCTDNEWEYSRFEDGHSSSELRELMIKYRQIIREEEEKGESRLSLSRIISSTYIINRHFSLIWYRGECFINI